MIDDPVIEQMIAEICLLTGETPEQAVATAVYEFAERNAKGPKRVAEPVEQERIVERHLL